MDPTQDDDHIILTWQMKAPVFSTDLDIFISEPYKSLPQNNCVDIRMHTDPVSETTKLVLLFREWSAFGDFSLLRSGIDMYHTSVPDPAQVWSPKGEIVLSICLVLRVLGRQTLSFLDSCAREVDKMVGGPVMLMSKTRRADSHLSRT